MTIATDASYASISAEKTVVAIFCVGMTTTSGMNYVNKCPSAGVFPLTPKLV